MMNRRGMAARAGAGILVLSLGVISGPWGAASGATGPSGHHYCAQTPTSLQCYGTLAELQATVPPMIAAITVGPSSASLDTILWSDANLSGDQLWLQNFNCGNTAAVTIPASFQKVTSSVQAMACGSITLRANSDGSGPSIRLVGNVNVGPAMNDQASSFSYP